MDGGPQDPAGGSAGLAQSAVNLTASKEARKRAELDAQLLANRIALLKQEEEKAWKKINETTTRTQAIVALRVENESKFQAKEQYYKEKWSAIRNAQSQNGDERAQARARRDASGQALLGAKQANHASTKQQSQQMLMAKKEREDGDRHANAERSNYIKVKKEEAKRGLEMERLEKIEKFRADYDARTSQEEMLRARTDALVAKMEREEMELIQRLQNTQTVQRNAYEELEAALGTTSQQISSGAKGSGKGQGQGQMRPAA